MSLEEEFEKRIKKEIEKALASHGVFDTSSTMPSTYSTNSGGIYIHDVEKLDDGGYHITVSNQFSYGTEVTTTGNTTSYVKLTPDGYVIWGYGTDSMDSIENLKPTKIIFNPPYTICFFPDGSKEIVKCGEGEEFVEEEGVMSCIMKKLFPSRTAFKKLVASGKTQPTKEQKKEKRLQAVAKKKEEKKDTNKPERKLFRSRLLK